MKPALPFAALALAALPLAAQDAEVGALVERLGSDSIAVRQRAESDLKSRGRAALPAVRQAATAHEDAEVRTRAAEVIRYLTEVRWRTDLGEALKAAAADRKPVLVFSSIGPLDGDI